MVKQIYATMLSVMSCSIMYTQSAVKKRENKKRKKLVLLPSNMFNVVNLSGLDFHMKFREASRARVWLHLNGLFLECFRLQTVGSHDLSALFGD